jgi:hypothetical protein
MGYYQDRFTEQCAPLTRALMAAVGATGPDAPDPKRALDAYTAGIIKIYADLLALADKDRDDREYAMASRFYVLVTPSTGSPRLISVTKQSVESAFDVDDPVDRRDLDGRYYYLNDDNQLDVVSTGKFESNGPPDFDEESTTIVYCVGSADLVAGRKVVGTVSYSER